jgi:hypothetical protein
MAVEPFKLKVSRSMQQLITSMQVHGGTVERFPGGYSFGTSTVEALVSRGIAEYSEWKDGRSGRFPIKAKLRSSEPQSGNDAVR